MLQLFLMMQVVELETSCFANVYEDATSLSGESQCICYFVP